MKIKSQKITKIYGYSNSWAAAPHKGLYNYVETLVELEINGNEQEGYHLVMHPEGFAIADYNFESLQEAKKLAEEVFEVKENEWA